MVYCRHTASGEPRFDLPDSAFYLIWFRFLTAGVFASGFFVRADGTPVRIYLSTFNIYQEEPKLKIKKPKETNNAPDYNNHVHEEGCRITEALRTGDIKRERYHAYQKMAEGILVSASRKNDTPKVNYQHKACTESFVCKVCGTLVVPDGAGSHHRNHCPKCLSSLHVDDEPGDRASLCNGIMDPVSVWVRKGGEWAIIHRCRLCGTFSSNRIAADDNPMLLMSIAVRPLSMPAFPLKDLTIL